MSSHWHDSSAGTQNQGNVLGARPCVRQSKLFRSYESGNGVKGLLGTPHLVWDETRQQGAYHNQPVWDHETGGGGYYSRASQQQYPTAAPEQQSNAARTYERSSQAYGSGYDHLPPHYHQQHQHQQHQRQQPPPPPSSGNSLLDDINAKRARNLAERHASIEADRLDDLRVARESEQLRAEVRFCGHANALLSNVNTRCCCILHRLKMRSATSATASSSWQHAKNRSSAL